MSKRRRRGIARHFQRRAMERLGHEFTNGSQQELVQMIQSRQATFLRRTSNNRTVWSIDLNGKSRTVVYDKKRKMVVTIW